MDILTYLSEENLSKAEFARQLDISKSAVTLFTNGGRRPSPSLALRIEQATGGAVTRDELLFPELYLQSHKEGS